MSKYEVIIYWSKEDDVYVAEVPQLAGCAAHGESQEEALRNAQDAISLWIETAKEFSDPTLSRLAADWFLPKRLLGNDSATRA